MEQLRTFLDTQLATVNLDAETEWLGNTVSDYVLSAVVFILAIILLKGVQVVVIGWLNRLAEKTVTDLDDTFIKMVKSFNPPFYTFLSFWLALQPLTIVGFAEKVVNAILIIWIVYQVVVAAGIFIEDVVFRKFAKDTDPTTQSALRIVARLAKGALWGIGVIVLLSNLGVDVTGLLAGVGIGGIAIAFALQGILGDLFSSFSIYFDKPYKVGDFIIVGDKMGVVQAIGIKSTRIRSLFGEEIIMSNQQMTGAEVLNYHDMQERRITFGFGILYETPYDTLKEVPNMVKTIIEGVDQVRFDRAHFKSYGDSSLDFEVVYYVLDGDYNLYMDIQQEINLGIFKKFEEEGIGFAYPTQTVYQTNLTPKA